MFSYVIINYEKNGDWGIKFVTFENWLIYKEFLKNKLYSSDESTLKFKP